MHGETDQVPVTSKRTYTKRRKVQDANEDDLCNLDGNKNSDANANTQFVMGSLLNIDNSCYMNAFLYSLRFTPNFTHYIHHLEQIIGILADRYEVDTNISENMCNQQMATARFALNSNQRVVDELPSGSNIFHEIHDTFTQLTASEKIRHNAVKPRTLEKIREAVQTVNDIFTPGEQQDAHEFLLAILNSIYDCSESLLKLGAKDPNLFNGINNEPAKLLSLSYFEENFMGSRVATKTCTNCNKTTSITEEFIDLNVTLTNQSEFNKDFIQVKQE